MELSELRGESYWIEVEGLRLLMRPPSIRAMLGDGSATIQEFLDGVEDWNVEEAGVPVPLNPNLIPPKLIAPALKEWVSGATGVSDPL